MDNRMMTARLLNPALPRLPATAPMRPRAPMARMRGSSEVGAPAASDPTGSFADPASSNSIDLGLNPAQALAVGLSMAVEHAPIGVTGALSMGHTIGKSATAPSTMSLGQQQAQTAANRAMAMGFNTPQVAAAAMGIDPAQAQQDIADFGFDMGDVGDTGVADAAAGVGPAGPAGAAAGTADPNSEIGGTGTGPGSDAGSGECVVATALTNHGLFTKRQKGEWLRYCSTSKHGTLLGEAQRRGYRKMFSPVARRIGSKPLVARFMRALAARYSDEITGRVRLKPVKWVLEPIACLVGAFVRK